MRWSNYFVPTLRDVPSEAEAASHGLLVKAGFIRQLQAGHYSMMPLGLRVQRKVEKIIREEIDAIGGQEMMTPTMHPGEIWKKSGRWDTMGEIMFRLVDRRGNDNALGITHEEIFSTVASGELTSYKQLPQLWYQIQIKFRDEARPKSGLLRVREFHMKDGYSFDVDQAGLDKQFDAHHEAYLKIFSRLGLDAFGVEASNGAMGGSDSVEFMVECPAGEDDVIKCTGCDYAANVERAVSKIPQVTDDSDPAAPEMFDTPGIRTIAALEEAGHSADRQLKTLVMVADGEILLAVVRGDHQLNLQKLSDQIGGPVELRPATPEEAKEALGAMPGSLGAVGVELRTIVDIELKGRTNMTTGANLDDKHLHGVNVERDIQNIEWLDIREAQAGETCIKCGSELTMLRCVETGHIFKLGTSYADKMGITIATPEGDVPVVMGSYGIGVERNMATVVESHHDDKGIVWPMSIAPFEVVLTTVKTDDDTMAVANKLYEELGAAGVDVLLDDRDARAGVKFADAELIGIPLRVTLGPKALADNNVELADRATGEQELVAVDAVVQRLVEQVAAAKVVS